jgi:hypothetical protein
MLAIDRMLNAVGSRAISKPGTRARYIARYSPDRWAVTRSERLHRTTPVPFLALAEPRGVEWCRTPDAEKCRYASTRPDFASARCRSLCAQNRVKLCVPAVVRSSSRRNFFPAVLAIARKLAYRRAQPPTPASALVAPGVGEAWHLRSLL